LRFDVMAKCIYAKHYWLAVRSPWAKELYLEHLRVMNNFQEIIPCKTSPQDFLNSFQTLLDSVHARGFDPGQSRPRIGRNAVLIDGAHRVAACLLRNQPIECSLVREVGEYNFSAAWFLRRR